MDDSLKWESFEITWKIKNISSFISSYDSPIFYSNNSQKFDWHLNICYFMIVSPVVNCYLESNCDLPGDTTVCYDVSISSQEKSNEKSGILTFRKKSFELLIKIYPKNEMFFGNLLVKVRLRDICDLSSLSHSLTFRTVVEVETQKVSFDIPHFNELLAKHEIFFRQLPVCKQSVHFEMKMWVAYDEDNVKTLHIDVTETLKILRFYLYCKISAKDPNGKLISSVSQTKTFPEKSDCVCSLKIPFTKEALKNFSSTNHKLSLKCEFKVSEGKITTCVVESATFLNSEDKSQNICNQCLGKEKINLRDDFLCLYVEGKHTDVVISAGGRKFPAHKTILSARSPVFAAMFNADMAEKESNLVEIVDIEAETVDRMLLFMYSEILKTEEYGDISKLYEAADKYQVQTLKDKCSSILQKFLDTQNAIEILILTDMHLDTELQDTVEKFIGSHAKKVFQTEEWKALMKENPSLSCRVMHKIWIENM